MSNSFTSPGSSSFRLGEAVGSPLSPVNSRYGSKVQSAQKAAVRVSMGKENNGGVEQRDLHVVMSLDFGARELSAGKQPLSSARSLRKAGSDNDLGEAMELMERGSAKEKVRGSLFARFSKKDLTDSNASKLGSDLVYGKGGEDDDGDLGISASRQRGRKRRRGSTGEGHFVKSEYLRWSIDSAGSTTSCSFGTGSSGSDSDRDVYSGFLSSDEEFDVRKSRSSVSVGAISGIPKKLNLTNGDILDVSDWDIISAPDSRKTRKGLGIDGSLGCNSWVVRNEDFVVKFSDSVKPNGTDKIYRSIMAETLHHEGINDFRVIRVKHEGKLRHGVISALVPSQLMDPDYIEEVLLRYSSAELMFVDEMVSDFDKDGAENLKVLDNLVGMGAKSLVKSGAVAVSSSVDDLCDYIALLKSQGLPVKFSESFYSYLRAHRQHNEFFVDRLIAAVRGAGSANAKLDGFETFNNKDKLLEKWGELCARRALNRCSVDNNSGNIAVRLDRSFLDQIEEGDRDFRESMRQYWERVEQLVSLRSGDISSILPPLRSVVAKKSFSYSSPKK